MALTSALFTGLSGLNVNQARLNVVGNNIANVNTVAFKSSRALFKPQFYVTDSAATPAGETFGGTNPSQRGLGAIVSAIEKDFSPGPVEPTGRPTDLAIDGDGFFILQGSSQRFTRDGSFSLNSNNQLVANNGDFVQGYGVDDGNNIITGTLRNLVIPLGTSTAAQATENVTMEGNLNADGAVATGATILNSQPLTVLGGGAAPTGATLLTDLAALDTPATPLITNGTEFTLSGKKGGRDLPDRTFVVGVDGTTVDDLLAFFQQGLGIDTTVPADATRPTPGATLETLASDDPNSARLVITGNVGEQNSLSLSGNAFSSPVGAPFTFTEGENVAGFTSGAAGESVHTSFDVYDSLGTPLTIDVTVVLETKADTGNTWRYFATSGDSTDTNLVIGTGTLTFDTAGRLVTSAGNTVTMPRENTGAATPLAIALDFGQMTSLTRDRSTINMRNQDGFPTGTLDSFSIGADGVITGSYSNGLSRTLGQVAIATFANPQGLNDLGGNVYTSSANSGEPTVKVPNEGGAGLIRSGALELSNVDLSQEFINLIIASTGFSASSRVITTSDELLTELLNASR
jgi:flagellar hook protein FlgE